MNTHRKDLIAVGIGIVLVVGLVMVFYPINTSTTFLKQEITSFEECIAAGNPAMESHPRKCRDPISDKTFTEDICPEGYSLDVDIVGCTKGDLDEGQKKAARIAIMPMSFYPVTISKVEKFDCDGCYNVHIKRDNSEIIMRFVNWKLLKGDTWELDGIVLMQHETEGYYGCFGCSAAEDGLAMCIDPIPEMKTVEETKVRYCNNNFEIIEN